MNTAQEAYLETAINKTTREDKPWEFDVNHLPALARAAAPQPRSQGHGCRTACGPSGLSMGLSLRPSSQRFTATAGRKTWQPPGEIQRDSLRHAMGAGCWQ